VLDPATFSRLRASSFVPTCLIVSSKCLGLLVESQSHPGLRGMNFADEEKSREDSMTPALFKVAAQLNKGFCQPDSALK